MFFHLRRVRSTAEIYNLDEDISYLKETDSIIAIEYYYAHGPSFGFLSSVTNLKLAAFVSYRQRFGIKLLPFQPGCALRRIMQTIQFQLSLLVRTRKG